MFLLQAESVLDLAAALGIERPNILGWSSGGNVGLVLAALHGDRVGKVASLAGMAGGQNTSEWQGAALAAAGRWLSVLAGLGPPESVESVQSMDGRAELADMRPILHFPLPPTRQPSAPVQLCPLPTRCSIQT